MFLLRVSTHPAERFVIGRSFLLTKKRTIPKEYIDTELPFWKWFYFLLSSLVELEHDSGHSRHHDIEDRVLFPFN